MKKIHDLRMATMAGAADPKAVNDELQDYRSALERLGGSSAPGRRQAKNFLELTGGVRVGRA